MFYLSIQIKLINMKKGVLLTYMLLAILAASAQQKSIEVKENDLVKYMTRALDHYGDETDSLAIFSQKFTEEITSLINDNPATLSYSFSKLSKVPGCSVATSDDGALRIYSWDTWSGGTMHFFKSIIQFLSNGKVYTLQPNIEEDTPCYYSQIYTLKTSDRTYYMPISNGVYSTKDLSQSISILTIGNGTICDTSAIIKTATRFTNSIFVEYDFFSVVESTERPVKLITFDPTSLILKVAIVLEDGKVTKRFIKYHFNGKFFERIRNNSGIPQSTSSKV